MKFFLLALLVVFSICRSAAAEIIDVRNEEKTFGEWKTFCEVDDMMNSAHCKIASKFFENSAVITVEPTGKFFNQLFIVIPQIKIGSFLQIRVDKNDLIFSQNVTERDFGLISINDEQKAALFQQMERGNFLFLRFIDRSSDKEITVKINLKDFRSAVAYYRNKSS